MKFVGGSRLAQFLFLVHLILVVYAFAAKPPQANSESWDSGGGCHGVPIADRVLFYCDETGLLKVIATLDFIGVALFALFATFYLLVGIFFWWVPDVGFHMFSWAVAVVLLIVTSFQWMLIGSLIERLIFRVVKNRRHV